MDKIAESISIFKQVSAELRVMLDRHRQGDKENKGRS